MDNKHGTNQYWVKGLISLDGHKRLKISVAQGFSGELCKEQI